MVGLTSSYFSGPAQHRSARVEVLGQLSLGMYLSVVAVAYAGVVDPQLVDMKQYHQISSVQPCQNTKLFIDEGSHSCSDS